MCDRDDGFDPDAPEWPTHPDDSFRIRNITPGTVYAAIDGRSDPDQVREIFTVVVELKKAGKLLPRVLNEFIAQGFSKFLENKVPTLDAAFGLTASRGRPRTDERVLIHRASRVLEKRLAGKRHENALKIVASELEIGRKFIVEAWRDYRQEACLQLMIERQLNGTKWKDEEKKILSKIFPEKKAAYLYCSICKKNRRVHVPEPSSESILPWRPRCRCGHEFTGEELCPVLEGYYRAVKRLSNRAIIKLPREQRRALAVEWGGVRYIQVRCPNCKSVRMIEVPAEAPVPWNPQCQVCTTVFVNVLTSGPQKCPE